MDFFSITAFALLTAAIIVIAAICEWLRGEEQPSEEDKADWQENHLHIFKEED